VDESEHPLQASFDPQGKRVVYCSQTNDRKILKILDIATGTRSVLDTGPGEADFPRWSPDGKMIAYVAKSGARWDVSVMSPDGSGRTVLTDGVSDLHGMEGPIDWSPDSARLAFKSDTDPFESRINVVEVKTHKVDIVTEGAWFYEAPSWTPDGKSLVFMSTRGGNWTWAFFRRSVTGGPYETLTKPDWGQKNFPRLGHGGTLLWSINDEQDREFISERGPDGKVKILEQAGEGARWPSYSPDESQVLYTVIEHRVEYWLAENVFGKGSSITVPESNNAEVGQVIQPPAESAAERTVRADAKADEQLCQVVTRDSRMGHSMMNLFRR
jgi:TolB protein